MGARIAHTLIRSERDFGRQNLEGSPRTAVVRLFRFLQTPSDLGSVKKARFRAVKRWTTAWPISPVRLPASIPTTHLPRRRRVPGLKKRRIPPPVLQESGHGSFLRKKSGFQKTDLLVPGFFRLQPTQEASGSVKVVVGFDDPCSLNPAGYSPPPCSDGDQVKRGISGHGTLLSENGSRATVR